LIVEGTSFQFEKQKKEESRKQGGGVGVGGDLRRRALYIEGNKLIEFNEKAGAAVEVSLASTQI